MVVGNVLAAMHESLSGSIGLRVAEQRPRQAKNKHACEHPAFNFLSSLLDPSERCLQSCPGRCFGLCKAPKRTSTDSPAAYYGSGRVC